MQNYNNSSEKENLGKKIVLEFLDFLRYKVENDKLTIEETESLAKCFLENTSVSGTAEDFAKFYSTSTHNVRMVINRRLIDKPQRKVLYPFGKFAKVIPKKWRE